MEKGLHDIRLEYFDDKGDALIQLYWNSDEISHEIIPEEQFFHIDNLSCQLPVMNNKPKVARHEAIMSNE